MNHGQVAYGWYRLAKQGLEWLSRPGASTSGAVCEAEDTPVCRTQVGAWYAVRGDAKAIMARHKDTWPATAVMVALRETGGEAARMAASGGGPGLADMAAWSTRRRCGAAGGRRGGMVVTRTMGEVNGGDAARKDDDAERQGRGFAQSAPQDRQDGVQGRNGDEG